MKHDKVVIFHCKHCKKISILGELFGEWRIPNEEIQEKIKEEDTKNIEAVCDECWRAE